MNILQLITKRQPRGAETFAVQLAGELHRLGHRVIIAALYAPADTPLAIPPTVKVVDLSDKQPRTIPHGPILRGIAELIRRESVDIVQANASDNLKYALLSRAVLRWKVPIVYRNASVMSAWIRSSAHRLVYGKLLRSVEAIASVSYLSKLDIQNNFGVPAERVHRLGIAVYLPDGSKSVNEELKRELTGADPATKLVFHVGAFTPEKNHAGLLRIFSRIKELCAFPVRLICIGNGPLLENVRQHAPPEVQFLGFRTDVPDLLPIADLLLLPSLIEGTPGVVLEAQANRVVPIAYRVGAVNECYPEQVYEELTVEKNDEEAMAKAASDLLTREDRRLNLSVQLRDFVSRQYAMQEVASAFAALYERTTAQFYSTRD